MTALELILIVMAITFVVGLLVMFMLRSDRRSYSGYRGSAGSSYDSSSTSWWIWSGSDHGSSDCSSSSSSSDYGSSDCGGSDGGGGFSCD